MLEGGMQLYKRLRREYEHGLGTIRGVAHKYKVHRRTVRAALKNAVPPKRKVTPRERPKMALAIPFIDAILEHGLEGDVQPATYGASDLGAAASRDAGMRYRGTDCPGVRAGPKG
jgi:hypothetical protein